MTILDLISLLSSRRFLLIGIFSAIVAAGMTVTFLLPPKYQSTMKILVTRDRVDPQVTPAQEAPDYSRGELTEEDFNSEIEILQSRTVLEGVVRQAGLDKMYAEAPKGWFARFRSRISSFYRSFHRQAAPDAMELAVTRLSSNLEATSIKKSRIIKVTYNDSTPERAAQFLNELYRQYAEHHLRMLQNSKAANVFHGQSEAFSQKLKEATETLKRFDARTGVTANAAQQGLLHQQLYETRNQLDKTRTEIRETEQRAETLKTQIKAQPERIESEARTKYVAALDKIKDEILTLELQRTQLAQKYQPNHRVVKEVEERLAQARDLLAREEKSPPQERAIVLNEVQRRLTSELLVAQANLAPLRERERRLAALGEQYRAQVAMFDANSLERADLERARAVNEEAYLLYRKKAQEADIVNALNQERIVNFSLAEAPEVNRTPVSPKPLVNFAALTVIGLAAAVAITAFIERDRRSLAEASLTEAGSAALPRPAKKDHAFSWRRATALLSNGSSRDSGRQFTCDKLEVWRAKAVVDYLCGVYNMPPRQLSEVLRETAGWDISPAKIDEMLMWPAPEVWRAKAVADYLRGAYRVPPAKLSEVLRETAGWDISPAKIDELLSRVIPETWRVKAVVDYLSGVYHMPPGKLSEVLRETGGWDISPAKIDEMLSWTMPEEWRAKAVVDYLNGVYHMPPGRLSEFLRETAGWDISPAKIDELLSRTIPDQQKNPISALDQ